jgi:Fe-S oxidoreductase
MTNQEITRQIFWGIPLVARIIFYCVAAASVGVSVYGFHRKYKLWRLGRSGEQIQNLRGRIIFLLNQVVLHRTIMRRKVAGISHLLIFVGFCVLFIGTVIVTLEYDTPLHFFYGTFYLLYKETLDIVGLIFLTGLAIAACRRYTMRPKSLFKRDVDSSVDAAYLLVILAAILITGYLTEGTRLAVLQPSWSSWSPIGSLVGHFLLAFNLSASRIQQVHFAIWWTHALLVLSFIASIPSTGFRHIFVSPLQVLLKSGRAKGALSTPFTLPEIAQLSSEREFHPGARTTQEFSWRQRLSFDACTSCGRCDDNCPALAAGTALSPKSLILKLRKQMENEATDGQKLLGSAISRDEIMACTTCRACMEHCPVSIEHVDIIVDVRRSLVDEWKLDEPMQKTLNNIATQYNPWGFPYVERATWAKRLPPSITERATTPAAAEVLYWVGCAASYDERANRVAVSFLRLLAAAGVQYALLGSEEKCNGELARRFGEEGLFQKLAEDNIKVLRRHQVRQIVATCPHCFNTLKNEYPRFGADFTVSDHATFLDQLISSGKLRSPHAGPEKSITYHDPCYLGRHNDVYETPRSVLTRIPGLRVTEMERNREKSFCCGAGGANYWYEVPRVEKCETIRLREAQGTKADTLAVACPFCLAMFTEAARKANVAEQFQVADVAEILAEHLPE